MAETQIKDLGSAGTIIGTLNFAVQHEAVDDIAQKTTQTELSVVGIIPDSDKLLVNQWLTPKAFTETTATETRIGTVELATDSDILLKTANKVLEASDIVAIIQSGIPASTDIFDYNIDTATEGTITANSLNKSLYGNRATIEGNFTFTPNVGTDEAIIYINNNTQPLFTQSGCGYLTSASNPNELHPMAVKLESVGSPVSGGGQIKITIGRGNTNWSSGTAYSLGISINYCAKI